MKKFYAFAAAAVAALSMNAQTLYVCGAGQGLAWDPSAPLEVALAGDAYTFDVDDLVQFKISTAMGTWNDFNAAAVCCADMTKDMLGQPQALSAGDGNIGTPWMGNYHIVVASDLSTITMTTTTPEPAGATPVYLRGDMNGWAVSEEWQMKSTDGVTYTFVCEGATAIEAGTKFKIADAGWGNINYGCGGPIEVGNAMTWNYNAENSVATDGFTGTITFELLGLKQPAAVTFTAGGSSVKGIEVAEGEAEYFNMQGVRVANPENGLYIVRKAGKVTKEFVR